MKEESPVILKEFGLPYMPVQLKHCIDQQRCYECRLKFRGIR